MYLSSHRDILQVISRTKIIAATFFPFQLLNNIYGFDFRSTDTDKTPYSGQCFLCPFNWRIKEIKADFWRERDQRFYFENLLFLLYFIIIRLCLVTINEIDIKLRDLNTRIIASLVTIIASYSLSQKLRNLLTAGRIISPKVSNEVSRYSTPDGTLTLKIIGDVRDVGLI